jgi:hypothetical protein
MGFWDALDEIAELASWETTLKDDGLGMLRIKISNHVRRSSPAERREMGKKLRGMRDMATDLDRRKLYDTMYEAYSDEAARA